MAQRKAKYEITPQMHALMRAQRVSALKAERAADRERRDRELDVEREELRLRRYGITPDDPRWLTVTRAVEKALDAGMDFRNIAACRKVADKALSDLERKERREETDVVYYLRVGDRIKIGTTKDVKQRLRAYPPGTELLATEPGSYLREQERHRQFADSLSARKEWFDPTPALLAHIDGLRAAA